MPYNIGAGSILEMSYHGKVDGQLFISQLHYLFATGTTIVDGEAAALEMIDNLNNAGNLSDDYLACIPDEVGGIRLRAQWITPIRYRYVVDPGGVRQGTVASPSMPSNVAVALTKTGEKANRHNIGTLHMPAVPASFIGDSLLTVLGQIAYDELCSDLPDNFILATGQDLRPVLFNRVAPSTSVQIVQAFPQDTSRVNRRRTVGLGA